MSDRAQKFWIAAAMWSNETFGDETKRGPIGPLKHLQKEINETLSEIRARDIKSIYNKEIESNGPGIESDRLLEEFADMQHLIFDACRRSGFTYKDLFDACFNKLEINKNRIWPNGTDNEPVEHKK